LVLRYNNIGDTGATALSGLKESPQLQQLTLYLGRNSIGTAGAAGLSGLKESPQLQQLTLNLWNNDIGAAGAIALSGLKESPQLQQLTLDLQENNIGDTGATALAGLKDSQSLQQFILSLGDNKIGDTGARALAGLKDSPQLKYLTLNLWGDKIGNRGAEELAKLNESKQLEQLTLNLNDNDIGDKGATALSRLKESQSLQQLTLDLGFNKIGDRGATALSELKKSLQLQQLNLKLKKNNISDTRVAALTNQATQIPNVQILGLDNQTATSHHHPSDTPLEKAQKTKDLREDIYQEVQYETAYIEKYAKNPAPQYLTQLKTHAPQLHQAIEPHITNNQIQIKYTTKANDTTQQDNKITIHITPLDLYENSEVATHEAYHALQLTEPNHPLIHQAQTYLQTLQTLSPEDLTELEKNLPQNNGDTISLITYLRNKKEPIPTEKIEHLKTTGHSHLEITEPEALANIGILLPQLTAVLKTKHDTAPNNQPRHLTPIIEALQEDEPDFTHYIQQPHLEIKITYNPTQTTTIKTRIPTHDTIHITLGQDAKYQAEQQETHLREKLSQTIHQLTTLLNDEKNKSNNIKILNGQTQNKITPEELQEALNEIAPNTTLPPIITHETIEEIEKTATKALSSLK